MYAISLTTRFASLEAYAVMKIQVGKLADVLRGALTSVVLTRLTVCSGLHNGDVKGNEEISLTLPGVI